MASAALLRPKAAAQSPEATPRGFAHFGASNAVSEASGALVSGEGLGRSPFGASRPGYGPLRGAGLGRASLVAWVEGGDGRRSGFVAEVERLALRRLERHLVLDATRRGLLAASAGDVAGAEV